MFYPYGQLHVKQFSFVSIHEHGLFDARQIFMHILYSIQKITFLNKYYGHISSMTMFHPITVFHHWGLR
jgi:hypothetical protein